MSDESSVQERAYKVLGDDTSNPRTHVRVDKKEFSKLLHQVLASRNLVIHLQSVAGENKKLKQRNEELERLVQRSQKTFSQIIIGDTKGSRSAQVRDYETGSMSLPTHFNFDSQYNPAPQTGRTFSSLGEPVSFTSAVPFQSQLGSYGRGSSLSQSVPSSLYVSGARENLIGDSILLKYSQSAKNIRERGFDHVHSCDTEGKEKSDPCKDEDTGQSLKVDGDLRSMSVIPQYIPPTITKLPSSPTTSPFISPVPSLSSVNEESESVAPDDQLVTEDVHVVTTGVSRQYFDVVVKELAKSKHLIKQLLAKTGERPQDVMDKIYLKQMIQSLEEDNLRLKDSNLYFRNLLVTEATSEDQNSSANTEILNFHDKVQKLERQLELKNTALDQLNKQCEIWKRYGQKAMAAQYNPKKDDQVFTVQSHDFASQTEAASFVTSSSQTDELPASRQSQRDQQVRAMLAESKSQVKGLEAMVADLTIENQRVQDTIEILSTQNLNLERSYQQVLDNLKELERNQDATALRDNIRGLIRENDELKKTLKDNAEEMKFLRYQVQSAQSEMGTLNQKKTRMEATLKTERERANQRETQLFTQCSRLQQQIYRLESENENLRTRIPSTQTNIARVQPVMKEVLQEPTSMPVMSYKDEDLLQYGGVKDASLMADSEHRTFGFRQSDPCLNLKSDDEEPFLCHHCLRNDFKDEKSFHQHMQKCGD